MNLPIVQLYFDTLDIVGTPSTLIQGIAVLTLQVAASMHNIKSQTYTKDNIFHQVRQSPHLLIFLFFCFFFALPDAQVYIRSFLGECALTNTDSNAN